MMTKPQVVQLVLVSAAETGWDATGRLVGRAAVVATDEALAGVHARVREGMIQGLLDGAPDLILCGPEDSSKATASLIGEALGVKSRITAGLANVDLGLWEGALMGEIEGRCPSIYKCWRDQPAGVRPPQGESLGEAGVRGAHAIRRSVDRLRAERVRVVVVVRPMLWGALLGVLGEEAWTNFWTLAGQTGQARAFERRVNELSPEHATASA